MRYVLLLLAILCMPLMAADVSRDIHAAAGGFAVTTSDTIEYTPPSRAIWVGGTGNLRVRLAGAASDVTFVNVQDGTLLPIAVDMVYATSTTATSIVFLR